MPKALPWLKTLRATVKQTVGAGWTVQEQSGRFKLTYRYAEGATEAKVVDLDFGPSNATRLATLVEGLRDTMQDRGLSLKDAYRLQAVARDVQDVDGGCNWSKVVESWLQSRAHLRDGTRHDDRKRAEKFLKLFSDRQKPHTGHEVMKLYAEANFAECPAGERGRVAHLRSVSQLLRYAIDEFGIDRRWAPATGEKLHQLIGYSVRSVADKETPPLRDNDLGNLLDALEADGKSSLWLMVGLSSIFGLRPAELCELQVQGGDLYVMRPTKRNNRTINKKSPPRLVLPLDLKTHPSLGMKLIGILKSGVIKMDSKFLEFAADKNYREAGHIMNVRLRYYKPWQALKARDPNITVYSLRHSYAWRAHTSYGVSMPIRVVSKLMGHSPKTHLEYYGRWVDQDDVRIWVEKLTGYESASTRQLTETPKA